MPTLVYHYTDLAGYNAIRAQPVWRFLAQRPPGDHPVGAYFTNLPPDTKNLAKKLLIPKSKLTHVFVFDDAGDLQAIEGGRGEWIVYSSGDYEVHESRQRGSELTGIG